MKLTRYQVYRIADKLEEIFWRFNSEKAERATDDGETSKTTKRVYVLNLTVGKVQFTLDDYGGVVYLEKEKPTVHSQAGHAGWLKCRKRYFYGF